MLSKMMVEAINIWSGKTTIYDNVYDINHCYSTVDGHESCKIRLLRLPEGQELADWIYVDLLWNDVIIHHPRIIKREKETKE